MRKSMGPAKRLLTVSAAVTAVLVIAAPANAESVLVTKVLSAISEAACPPKSIRSCREDLDFHAKSLWLWKR